MIPVKLTEYRKNGKDYPILILLGEGVVIREADLEASGPTILPKFKDGEKVEEGTKPAGKGSFITIPFNQVPITVRETLDEIAALVVVAKGKRAPKQV